MAFLNMAIRNLKYYDVARLHPGILFFVIGKALGVKIISAMYN